MKPVIGITSEYGYEDRKKFNRVLTTYTDVILEVGGIPLIIPIVNDKKTINKYLDLIDGLLFTGGEDISPLIYDENPIKEVVDISYDRDSMELELFKRAHERKLPILGICRGLQLINVALGGTLYQDIHAQLPFALGHVSTYDLSGGYHSIEIINDTILYDVLGVRKIDVNSNHHQSIKNLGNDLRINCFSKDGIVEGIESIKNCSFILALQFHPEEMVHRHREFINIFEYFVLHCM